MWIFTPIGFYSVAYKPDEAKQYAGDEELLVIRSRTEQDLLNLKEQIPDLKIHRSPTSDYKWRAYCSREDFALFMATFVLAMDYSNFKNEVARTQGRERSSVYHEVWDAVFYGLDESMEDRRRADDSQLSFGWTGDPEDPKDQTEAIFYNTDWWKDDYTYQAPDHDPSKYPKGSEIDWEEVTRIVKGEDEGTELPKA